jgi:hypothetical protein
MIKKILALGGGFLAGTIANNLWEINRWYGYGVRAIPLNNKAFGVDDVILIIIGLAIGAYGYFAKQPLALWFGIGWVIAQLADKAMELME